MSALDILVRRGVLLAVLSTGARRRTLPGPRGLWAALALAVVLAAPGAASGHDGSHDVVTEQDHAAQDSVVVKDAATEQRLTEQTVAASRADSMEAAASVTGTEGEVGQWGPLEDWPVVGIHVALLPNGNVVAYDASSLDDRSYTKTTDHTFTRGTVYDPATGAHAPAWVTAYNIFCSGLAHLPNGLLFAAGGNADQFSNGIVQTHTFDHASNDWIRGADMQFARWYPTVTPLNNGEMLIIGGRPWIPEVRRTDGTIRALSEQTAALDVPFYPWMDTAPDGRVFYSGPDDNLRALDPAGGGAWQMFGPRDGEYREYGSHAVYDVGKILVAGGGLSSKTARTIDINAAAPRVSATSPMSFGRRQFNLTVLADGKVLATGGNSTGAHSVDMDGGVYQAELWDPATGTWTTLAAEQVTRQYHSTALLLADGRVLSSGGGICDDCDGVGYLAKNAQIFSPPYLFKKDGSGELAPRPAISAAPSAVDYGASFEISTPNATSIRKVGLVRLGAVTHSVNMGQRYVPLSFTAGSGALTATAAPNANVAPPGVYMLFIVDAAGVPSVAKMITVGAAAPPPPPPPPPPGNEPPTATLTQPADGATFTAPATVRLEAEAADTDGHVTVVQFYNGTAKIGEDMAAPFTFDWSGVGPGTYTLTAKATDEDGATTTSAARTITVSPPPNQPPTVTLDKPQNGATFTAPATVRLEATAADTDGHVTVVQFYSGTTKLGEDSTAPFTFDWTGVGPGTYSLTAKATDEDGATTTSAPSTITVNDPNQPPAVTLTRPLNGATYPAPATVSFAAMASDGDGTVAKVEFFSGTTEVGEDTTAPYSFDWTGVGPGTYAVTARATDDDGATATSSVATVKIIGSNQPPTASITSPTDGRTFRYKEPIPISATATDPDGSVAGVEFLAGTTVLSRDTSAPYSYTWRNAPVGSHALRVRATDNVGAVTLSDPVAITVRR